MTRPPAPAVLSLLALILIAPYLLGTPRPSADAELARAYAAGLRPWQWQPMWSGGSPAWMAGSPLLATLTAAIGSLGVSFERADLLLGGIFYILAVLSVYYLARALLLPAAWTTLAFALAPYRWSDLARSGNAAHAAALALLPFTALLFLRRRVLAGAAGVVAMLLFSLPPRAHFSPLPEIELAIAIAAGWLAKRRARLLPVFACSAVFAAALSWQMLFARPDAPPTVDAATVTWLARHVPGETALSPSAPQPRLNALRRQAETLILTPTLNPVRRLYALLWLEALGYSHLVSAAEAECTPVLEPEYDDNAGFRVYHALVHRPAAAVLVSRYQWQSLPRLRSLYDRAALKAYVAWANRPEAAALRWTGPRTAEITASLGPEDMILVRQTAAPGWRATLDGRTLPCLRDPIGFLLLDPQRSGPVVIHLAAPSSFALPSAIPALPEHPIPTINSNGIVDGVRHTPPPFAAGTIITIFGADLGESGATKVLAAGRACEVLYASDLQINARLPADLPPGRAPIVVRYAGGESEPYSVDIQ